MDGEKLRIRGIHNVPKTVKKEAGLCDGFLTVFGMKQLQGVSIYNLLIITKNINPSPVVSVGSLGYGSILHRTGYNYRGRSVGVLGNVL